MSQAGQHGGGEAWGCEEEPEEPDHLSRYGQCEALWLAAFPLQDSAGCP